ncbi:polysaccharide biosynthesis protein [Drancourtella massiliensis]|uniref:Polysaccharide biosynthesis protein n=1 Tax=Drancourtella massiliensis TaxID=1632013 RepID=A0ABS2EH72_9FIRM|nr:polysaccharide biosynthesis protein [Drancourtella massiliensis]
MKISRTKNASRNIVFGTLLRLYQTICPFVIRTVMIYTLGMEYLGLNSLFTSILQVLNLTELGVGSAMTFSMYKPIVEDDTERICALMRLYKIYYRVIGTVILFLGLVIMPFLPDLISGEVPANINVYVLYILNLFATVFSYWLFAYKNCLVVAHQRTDIQSKVNLFIGTFQYILQAAILFVFRNYYLYLCIALLSQSMINIVTAIITNKLYPKYQAVGKLDKKSVMDINQKVRDLFTAKIGGVVVNSADSIVISAFLGLVVLAQYNNYYYILSAIMGFVSIIFNSCTAGIGNSIITETSDKNYHDFQIFTFIVNWLAGVCVCCFLVLYQPFMTIWVGQENTLSFSIVICFCVYFYVYELNCLYNLYKDSAGIWHEDRFRPLVTALTNLTLNLITVQFWGLYGVILSTVISMVCVGTPWCIYNVFCTVFKRSMKDYLPSLFKHISITAVVALITYTVCNFLPDGGFIFLFLKAIVCAVISNILYLLIYYRNTEFKETVQLVKRMIGRLN